MIDRNLRFFAHGLVIGLLAFAAAFSIAGLGSIVGNSITSFAINENVIGYSQDANILADHSITVPIALDSHPRKFDLSYFKISGKVKEGSDIKVYLDNGRRRLLVYSTSGPLSMTGSAIDFDNVAIPENPVLETAPEEMPVAETPIAEQPAINPSEQIPAETANESPAVAKPSQNQEIQLNSFSSKCEDTCDIRNKGFDTGNYNLVIEVNSGSIEIDSFDYGAVDLGKKVMRAQSFEVDSVVYDLLEKGNGKAQVMIEFKRGGNGKGSVMSAESNTNDFKVLHNYNDLNAMAAEIDSAGFEKLLSSGEISRIYPDEVLTVQLADSVPQINAPEAWKKQVDGVNITGKGQTVCVIDTGVDASHSALAGRVIAQKCFCYVSGTNCCPNGNNVDDNANDDNGHGTHVAGIIASNDLTYRGIAPEADIVAVKVCNSAGSCASSDIIAGIGFCTSNAALYNISAISLSIGGTIPYSGYCDSTSSSMTTAINNAVNNGLLMSIAAGNYNHNNGVSWPSCVEKATGVSAVDKSDAITDYSNRASSVTDLLGVGGSSSNPITSLAVSNSFAAKYGTSMAAPHVSGVVALLQQYSRLYNGRTMNVAEIEGLLKRTGKPITDPSTGAVYRRIDVGAAINSILKIDNSELSVEREGFGKIKFDGSVDLGAASEAFRVSQNFVSLDSAQYPSLDAPADITFYNLTFEKTPVVLKDGDVCTDCSPISYGNGSFSFHVNGFSNYSASQNSNLEVWSSADYGMPHYSGNGTLYSNITFFGSYVNRSGMQPLSDAACNITFSDIASSMEFNPSEGVYGFSRNFASEGSYSFTVRCSGQSSETLNISDDISVTKLYPSFSLKLNGGESNISVIRNSGARINSSLSNPDESLNVYLNGNLINSGKSTENVTSFSDLGSNNVTASYAGSLSYYPLSKTSWINVINDVTPPQFSNLSNPYGSFDENLALSINVDDDVEVGSVWLMENFSGAMQSHYLQSSGGIYSYSTSGLSMGNYSFSWDANDTSGNENSTGTLNFEVRRGKNPVRIYINGQSMNSAISYGSALNVTAYGKGNVYLFRDNMPVGNPDNSILDAKTSYAYFANSSGDGSYVENSTGASLGLNVTKAPSTVHLRLNGYHGSASTSSSSATLRAELTTPSTGAVSLYRGSTLLTSGSAPLESTQSFSSGTYAINASYNGSSNYLTSSEAFTLTVSSSSTTSSSSSSTSSSTTSTSCTPNWRCSDFYECSSGVQDRACYDLNNCGTLIGKPAVQQSCSSSLSFPAPYSGSAQENETLAVQKATRAETSLAVSSFFSSISGFASYLSNQIEEEPIIILPIIALGAVIALMAMNGLSRLRTRLKKAKNLKSSVKKSLKNEMRHMRKGN